MIKSPLRLVKEKKENYLFMSTNQHFNTSEIKTNTHVK